MIPSVTAYIPITKASLSSSPLLKIHSTPLQTHQPPNGSSSSKLRPIPVTHSPGQDAVSITANKHKNVTLDNNSNDKIKEKNTNIFMEHLKRQRQYFHKRLMPTAASSTTQIQKITPILNSAPGIEINHKGKPKHRMSAHSLNSQKYHNQNLKLKMSPMPKTTEKNLESISGEKSSRNKNRRLSSAMLDSLNPRLKRNNFHKRLNTGSHPLASVNNDAQSGSTKKIVKKNISRVEAKIVASSGIRNPLGDRNASESVPVVIVTTQTPIITGVTHKKMVNSRTYKSPKYTYRNTQIYNEPLHSRYGPPYDHYKFSGHRSPGRSFPPPSLPLYHSDNKFLQDRIIQTQVPHFSESLIKMKDRMKAKPMTHFFEKGPIFLPSITPRPPTIPSAAYKKFTPPKMKSPEMFPHKISDPYFQPYNPPNSREKKIAIAFQAKGKSISTDKTHTHSKDYIARYSAVSEGIPGVDYPAYSKIPYTKFTCKDKRTPGIYGDAEAGCQVWHICEADGRQHSFLCPNGTIFNQQLLTCDWWYNVQCSDTGDFYHKKPSMNFDELNHIRTEDYKQEVNEPFPKLQQVKWSLYSNITLTKRPSRMNTLPASQPVRFLSSARLKQPPIFSPRGSKSITTAAPTSPPKFVEFQPYHGDTYPMFQIRKRHVKKHRSF